MGAVVRAFDTRAAVKEQVESLGAEFLTVDIEEVLKCARRSARLFTLQRMIAVWRRRWRIREGNESRVHQSRDGALP